MKIRFMCMQHYSDLNNFEGPVDPAPGTRVNALVIGDDGIMEFDLSDFECPDGGIVCGGRWTAVLYNNWSMPGEPDIALKMADNGRNFIKAEET
jgi:hypothetical protein